MAKGIGLILIGFALFMLSRPYMEIAAGEDAPPPPPRWAPFKHKAFHITRRGKAAIRVAIGQLIGLAGMVTGVIVVLNSA
ncbi:MAG TPA: hypothetical protein VJU79_07810 [Candidatus Dormibacteraeota bacterium]|nr:hypothetical protein [Candidatus Dormibacteraeota bacterium]